MSNNYNSHGASFLITGGAGFIGSNIVEYLLKLKPAKVRVLDNFSTGSRRNLVSFLEHPAFELIVGDVRDYHTCKKAMKGVNYVSHQAALGSVPRSIHDPLSTNSVNINGFLNVLQAAREENVTRMVFAASSSTYGDHPELPKVEGNIGNLLSPYAVTKYVNELYAKVFSRTYGFHTIGLRYFNIFGPRQNPKGAYAAVIPLFIKAAIEQQQPLIFGDGETSRDFTYIDNAVQANVKALFRENVTSTEIMNIAVGESTTLNKLWDLICNYAGISLSPIYKSDRIGDVKYSLADISKAKKYLGYDPKIDINRGLQLTFDWYAESMRFPDINEVTAEMSINQ